MKSKPLIFACVVSAPGLLLICGPGSAKAAAEISSPAAANPTVLLASNAVASGKPRVAEAPDTEHKAREWQEHYERIRERERRALEMERKGMEMQQRGMQMEQKGVEEEQRLQEEDRKWWEEWKRHNESGNGGD